MVTLSEAFAVPARGVVSFVGAGGKTTLMFRLAHERVARGQSVITTTTTRIMRPTPEQSSALVLEENVRAIVDELARLSSRTPHVTVAAGEMTCTGKLDGISRETADDLAATAGFDWILVEADGAARRPLKAPAAHEPVIPSSSAVIVGVAGLDGLGHPLGAGWVFRPEIFARLSGLDPEDTVDEESVAAVFCHPDGIFKGAPAGAQRIAVLNKADTPERIAAAHRIARFIRQRGSCGLDRVVLTAGRRSEAVVG